MESENEVPLEDEKKVIIEKSNGDEGSSSLDVNKTNDPCENDVCKDDKTDKEVPNSSVSSPSLSKSKTPTASKLNKLTKNHSTSLRTSVVFGRSTKQSLTQSLSFPGRGRNSDVMKRSIEVYPSKSDIKQSQKNSSKIVANGSSSPRISSVGKGPFPGVNSKSVATSGKAAGRRTTLSSMPSLKQSGSGKNVTADVNAASPATDVLVAKDSEASNSTLAVKEEDARSTTSSNLTPRTQQRLNVSAFSFRLEERAEKRKEFFSKIEQKVQAKEVEKNNLQEKSKENHEAEIKQLRKGLTFKATPMPNFYKEPLPKVELKKIPTTRPVSPKLGRNKSTLENGGSSVSPRVSRDNNCKSPKTPKANGDKGNSFLRKSVKSSLSKPNNQESTTPRKVKNAENEGQGKQTHAPEEFQSRPRCTPEIVDEIEEEAENNSTFCSNGSNVPSSNSGAVPVGVAVEG